MAGLSLDYEGEMVRNGSFHYVAQDYRLFNLSLRDNITYGLSEVADIEIWDKLKQVGLSALVAKMKLGLNTIVGEMGIRLSGGEKLRVALARALLTKPDTLYLDETLDTLSFEDESSILKTIFKTIPTVVIVSHHPSIIKQMDKVYTLENGVLKVNKKRYFKEETYA
jgi:ABC-type multidrug transport system fused ATPase/permease subunit